MDDMFPNGNPVIYDLFIGALTDELQGVTPTATQYDAICLTVPDSKFAWNALNSKGDPFSHFLDGIRNILEQSKKDILQIVITQADRLIDRAEFSSKQIFTYKDFQYLQKRFEHIIGAQTKAQTYNAMLDILKNLVINRSLPDICRQDSVVEFLNSCSPYQDLENWEKKDKFDEISICFQKIICAVILLSAGRNLPEGFEVRPRTALLPVVFWEEYNNLRSSLTSVFTVDDKLRLYERLYDMITAGNKSDELINRAANDCFVDFFSLVNTKEQQNDLLLRSDINISQYVKIFNLYHLFYKHIKYALYRTTWMVNDSNGWGLMRYSLTDREIVLRYVETFLKDKTSEVLFNRLKHDGSVGEFVIRLATKDDIDNIMLLSEPPIPYRRAIFINSNRDELNEAANKEQMWVIEEIIDGIKILACSAIILYNDINHHYDMFYAAEMNERYRKKYYGGNNSNFKYMDFDSILVNDGRSRIGNQSYRGYGFQRLMLILAEELATIMECDYICATVSTFNQSSKRNFELNGYIVEDNEKYTFKEPSRFYHYITTEASEQEVEQNKKDIELEIAKYGDTFDSLNISKEEYVKETIAPRDFVVLNLKDNK